MRLVDDTDGDPSNKLDPMRNIWIRLTGTPPRDPLLRAALLVYISDRTLLSTSLRPLGRTPGGDTMVASLDHAVWLHRPPALEDWFLYSARSPAAHAGRALVHGAMYSLEGKRIASVAQEGLIRSRRKA
jgi:acyl-CoA thioesterase-2